MQIRGIEISEHIVRHEVDKMVDKHIPVSDNVYQIIDLYSRANGCIPEELTLTNYEASLEYIMDTLTINEKVELIDDIFKYFNQCSLKESGITFITRSESGDIDFLDYDNHEIADTAFNQFMEDHAPRAVFDYIDQWLPTKTVEMEPRGFFIVSDWLANQLKSKGEAVSDDFLGLTIWGRQDEGSSISMDSVIREIWAENIAPNTMQDYLSGDVDSSCSTPTEMTFG